MDAEERALLAATLGQLASAHDGGELTKALEHFGFTDLLATSPREAVSALFTAMGRAGSMSAAVQEVLARPLARLTGPGWPRSAILLPAAGQQLAGTLEDGTLNVRGLVLGPRPGGAFLAPVTSAGEIVWVRLPDPGKAATRVIAGLDPGLGLTEITLAEITLAEITLAAGAAQPGGPGATVTTPARAAPGGAANVVLRGEDAAQGWQAVAAAGRRALGYQIVGAVSQMLDLAVAHARERVQFGQPVGSFQAVRHRLADAFVAREGAAAALELAWEADDEQLAAMLAKSLAGRAARIAAVQCQQVLAGVGFTAEHPFHRYLARTVVLDRVLGSAAELPAELGARLAAAGGIPRLAEL